MENIENIKIIQQCYVYPSGGCAEICVNILKDCLENVEFIMLDDKEEATSLEAHKDRILLSKDYLLICAGDVQEELEEKCKRYGISNAIDGRVYTALKLSEKIREQIQAQKKKFEFLANGNVLHILENRWITHLYYFWDAFAYYLEDCVFEFLKEVALQYCESMGLQEYLKVQQGILIGVGYLTEFVKSVEETQSVVVYCGDFNFYQEVKAKLGGHKALCCHWVLLDYFINQKAFFTNGGLLFNFAQRKEKVVKIGCGHSLCEAFYFAPKRQKKEFLVRYIQRYFDEFDYYLAIDKISQEAFEAMFEECGVTTKVLKAGSLSLDSKGINTKDQVESFMFIPRLNGKECVAVIKRLLKLGKKVIFRPHPATLNYVKQHKIAAYTYLEDVLDNNNFCIDSTKNINQELLAKSIVITDNSSVSYSTPLSTLRPVVLFCPPKKEFDLRVQNFGISFANPILHRVALSVDDCVEALLQLEAELSAGGGAFLREKILKYREMNLYNIGHSKEAIAEILKDIMNGKI